MKQFKQMMLAGAVATVMCGSAWAAEVGNITTFTAGMPAQAAQVNGNFTALTAAVNDNNTRIEALEAALAVSSSVSGRYYKLRDIGWIMGADRLGSTPAQTLPDSETSVADGFARIGFYVGNIDMYFDANGTFTILGNDIDVEMFVNTATNIGIETNEASGSGSWVQEGNTLTMTFYDENQNVDDVLEFTVSKGGLALTANHTGLMEVWSSQTDVHFHEYDGGLIIAVEVDAPQP